MTRTLTSLILDDLQNSQLWIENDINATPTGERRNKLTEGNIFLLAAIKAIKEASLLPHPLE